MNALSTPHAITRPINITVDCRSVFPGRGGIGRYAESLVQHLVDARSLREAPVPWDWTVLTTEKQTEPISQAPRLEQRAVSGRMIDPQWEQLQLPILLQSIGCDLYHNTCFSLPVVRTTRWQIATVHDVVFRAQPDLVEPRLRDYLDHWTAHAVRTADAIITVSAYSKADICRHYGAEPERVHVVYNGVDRALTRPGATERRRIAERYMLPDRYMLYLGALEPKKNIGRLLEACRILVDRGQGVPLILAGGLGSMAFDLDGEVRRLRLEKWVRHLGYLPEADVAGVLANAMVFVYPSLFEGFGLPPLEAMACGTAVVVSDSTCLPEIVGDAGLVAVHDAADDLAAKISLITRNDEYRKELVQRGLSRIREFRWSRTAEQTLAVYRAVMGDVA